MENQPKAPKGNEQRWHIPSNRYVRTTAAATTIQPTASPPRDVHAHTRNPRETKPPEELHNMIAEKTTVNYNKCIAKYNKISSTHSLIPLYVELCSKHSIEEGDEQL
eukprot:15120073-Ditylum_brightwellii.AAC.1